jgi:hypothetical protein
MTSWLHSFESSNAIIASFQEANNNNAVFHQKWIPAQTWAEAHQYNLPESKQYNQEDLAKALSLKSSRWLTNMMIFFLTTSRKITLESLDNSTQKTALESLDDSTQKTALESLDKSTQKRALESLDEVEAKKSTIKDSTAKVHFNKSGSF